MVLAGGANTRFGGALKGLSSLGSQRIVDRVLAAVAAAADQVIVIANPTLRAQLPAVPVFGDARPERGALVGLHSGLTRAGDAVLVVAWDMPFLSSELLRELRRRGEERDIAVVPEGPRGPEPLCAYYPRSSLPVIEQQLARGDLRLGHFVRALPARTIMPSSDVARFGDPERLFANINTPAELDAAERTLASASGHPAQDLSQTPLQ